MPGQITKTLSRLGLKETEVAVYLACLQSADGLFASEIARLTASKRSTTDLILARLLEQGYLTYHINGSRKRYYAEPPEKLLSQFEDTLDEIRSCIPLLHMAGGSDSESKVRFFSGQSGLEHMFHDILLTMRMSRDPKKEILLISSGRDVFETLPDHQRQFIDKRVKAKIPTRWIAPKAEAMKRMEQSAKEELRSIKFFNGKKYPFTMEIDIYATSLALMNLRSKPSGVIIENKQVADSFRSLFGVLWEALK
jgi:sugar-specific transcriptional regulator TrmB